MDIQYIKKIIKLVESSGVSELEIEEEGKRIRIAKNLLTKQITTEISRTPENSSPSVISEVQQNQATQPSIPKPPEEKVEKTYHEIKSPIVGTFYQAPAPGAEPYVRVGQNVQVGTVLCIIEAMKLMNEIESDVAGTIVKVCVENGQPVEYNQTLFLIEPLK